MFGTVTVQDCIGVEIKNNDISREGLGIELVETDSSSIKNNVIHDKYYNSPLGIAILLWGSNSNTIKNNHTYDNNNGIYLSGSSYNNIQMNISNRDVDGGFILVDDYVPQHRMSNFNLVSHNQASGSRLGFIVQVSTQNVLKENRADDNWKGIEISFAEQNVITDCVCNNNKFKGFDFFKADNNLMTGVTANNNASFGIYVDGSNNNIKNSRANGSGICDYYDLGIDNTSENNKFGSICTN
jgi:parallel beta-helix repeat protein